MSAYYVIFQFSHAYTRLFFPWITKRLQNIFNVVTKQRQNWNIERIMQFFRIAAYVQVANCMAWYIMRLVHFALYKWLAVCACGCGCSGCLCSLGLYGHWVRESVSVFDGLFFVFVSVDVKYIIHYKRICKFIYSL